MEPLSAFSLACNVIQIVEVGWKLLSTAADYRNATDGATTEQKELREIARTLKNLSAGLQSSLPDPTKASQLSPEETRLLEANNGCLRLSKDFMNLLDSLKLKDRQSTLESLRMSIKARWYKDRMDAMQKALSQARDNVNIAFLIYMHAQQATASAQISDEISTSASRVEQTILAAVNSSSDSVQNEVRNLAEQLKDTYLDSDAQTTSKFLSAHQDALEEIASHLKVMGASQKQHHIAETVDRIEVAQQRILNSLFFNELYDREHQIPSAYSKTYEWMLQPLRHRWQRWSCFGTWIQAQSSSQRIYWIHGKPGSGKSTVLKFLDNNLKAEHHMSFWAEGYPVLKLRYFFWNPGGIFQKSLGSFYRSLLFQLLEQFPSMIAQVTSARKWQIALMSSASQIEWAVLELATTLRHLIQSLETRSKILLLIDGLDEMEGGEEELDILISYLLSLVEAPHVKICVSSREWNIFRDAFGQYPQLRLEDLTHQDISTYTIASLQSNGRWRSFQQYYATESAALINTIIQKAAGVFLWVRLVVRELLSGLRDGDSLTQLKQKLELIPADLEEYFTRIINSIKSKHRREASALLQLALFEETKFASICSLRLIDISFLEEKREDFATVPGFDFRCLDIMDRNSLLFRTESALRKLNSRCMGLLECGGDLAWKAVALRLVHESGSASAEVSNAGKLDTAENVDMVTNLQQLDVVQLRQVTGFKIEFLHRTLRDFLLTPTIQKLLLQYTDGALNARLFLSNARLVEFMAFARESVGRARAVALASQVLSTLSVDGNSNYSTMIANIMDRAVQKLAGKFQRGDSAGLYIDAPLETWINEKSTFLTLAIDFNLESYVAQHLTPQAIQDKDGRPILDYVLRPRFPRLADDINNKWPNSRLLKALLDQGSNPNEVYKHEGASVWALFLCFLRDGKPARDKTHKNFDAERTAYYEALQMMIRAGAEPFLSGTILSAYYTNQGYRKNWKIEIEDPCERFCRRWPAALPTDFDDALLILERQFAVSQLLDSFRDYFGSGVDVLIDDLKSREPKSLAIMSRDG